MRTRYIKPDFFRDEHLKNLSYEVRLLFAGLWTQADREGRLLDRPERLKIELMPYDKVDINKLLDTLAKPKTNSCRPFIYRYEVEGERYIQIVNWHKHQKPHHAEPQSKIPPIPPTYTYNSNCNNNLNMYFNGASNELEDSNRSNTVVEPLLNGSEHKQKFLDFVLLTKEEYQKLLDKLGEQLTQDYISRLNDYIGSSGKRYNSHYHTILTWLRKNKLIEEAVNKSVRRIL